MNVKYILKTTAKNLFLNSFAFVVLLSIKRHINPSILFYEGMVVIIITTTCLIVFNNYQNSNDKEVELHNFYQLIISFFVILTMHTTIITIVDRSISVFMISEIKNKNVTSEVLKKNFDMNFGRGGIDKRIEEQYKIGNIVFVQDSIRLTDKGKIYYQLFLFTQKLFNTDQEIIK